MLKYEHIGQFELVKIHDKSKNYVLEKVSIHPLRAGYHHMYTCNHTFIKWVDIFGEVLV
jgi:hypothetical protein